MQDVPTGITRRATEPLAPDDHQSVSDPSSVVLVDRPLRIAVIGIFLLGLCAALFFARSFFLPVFIAFLLALVLSPVVRALAKKGVPEAASALILVATAVAIMLTSIYFLSGPVSEWAGNAPQIRQQIQVRIAELRGAVEAVQEATRELDDMAEAEEPGVQRVAIREQGLLGQAASGLPQATAQILLILVLLLFLLASGDLFFEKLVKVLPTMTDKKRGLRIAKGVERAVSQYLLTISVINMCLGAAVAAVMFAIVMPSPILWGVMAALLNFIPYIGALIGAAAVTIVAILSFQEVGMMVLAPLLYLACTTIEGNFITPAVVGRRLEMNPVVVFLSIAFWGWLWGIMGVLIAVPILVIVKVFADHMEGLGGLGEFLSARDMPSTSAEPEEDGMGERQ